MARTNAAAVKLVLGKQYDTTNEPDLTPYIDAASAIVDDVEECDGDGDDVLDGTRLEIIERWLAAYKYLLLDPPYKSRATLSASGSWDQDVNRLKEMAISLDKSGCLAGILNGRATASVDWLGKLTQEELDWTERNTE